MGFDLCPKCKALSLNYDVKSKRASCHRCEFWRKVKDEEDYNRRFVYTVTNWPNYLMRMPEPSRVICPSTICDNRDQILDLLSKRAMLEDVSFLQKNPEVQEKIDSEISEITTMCTGCEWQVACIKTIHNEFL